MTASRIAITGAAGFLGQHLVRAWRAAGNHVVPFVREQDARSPEGAVRLEDALREPARFDGVDILIHVAAIRHQHQADAKSYRVSNVELVERLLGAVAGRVRRVVYVSSVGVYGFPNELPVRESHPFVPRTLYSATKVEAEKVAREMADKNGTELTIVRPTIVYGPGDNNGMLDKMARMIRAGTYRVVGDGSNVLHHTYVDDITDGIRLAAEHPAAAGDHFILAGPETITLSALSKLVAEAVGGRVSRPRIPIHVARAVAGVIDLLRYRGLAYADKEPPINGEKLDVMCRPIAFDSEKARRVLGYRPRVYYREGVPHALLESQHERDV